MVNNQMSLPQCFGCNNCGDCSSISRAICPKCVNTEIVLLEGAKMGEILDLVPIFYPLENLKHLGQYLSVLVKLENGCKIFGIISGESKNLQIGTSVIVSIYDKDTKEIFFDINHRGC